MIAGVNIKPGSRHTGFGHNQAPGLMRSHTDMMIFQIIMLLCITFSFEAKAACIDEVPVDERDRILNNEWSVGSSSMHMNPFCVLTLSTPSFFGNQVLFRCVDGKWTKWVTLRSARKTAVGDPCDHFKPIFWKDNEYLYLLNCRGDTKEKDYSKRTMQIDLYKISLNKKEIIAKTKSEFCLGDLPCFMENCNYKTMTSGTELLLIITDHDVDENLSGTKLIRFNSDLKKEAGCCLLDKNDAITEISTEVKGDVLEVKLKDVDNKIIEKTVHLKEEQSGVCH